MVIDGMLAIVSFDTNEPLNARVGTFGAEVHGIYTFKAEAEDRAKVPGNARCVSNNAPGFEWTAQP